MSEKVDDPRIIKPTDAIIKLSATCICGSDLWPYRGLQPMDGPMHMGHEYCGVAVEVGSEVRTIRPGQFVVGSFWLSDNTCPHCRYELRIKELTRGVGADAVLECVGTQSP